MIYLIGLLILLLVLSWFAIWMAVTKSVVRSIGAPTPEDARINRETEETTKKINVGAETEKEKVRNATAGELLARARDELRNK